MRLNLTHQWTLGGLLSLCLFVSCTASPPRATVEAYGSSSVALESLQTFSYAQQDGTDSLLRDRSMAEHVGAILRQKGLTQSTTQVADFFIQLHVNSEETTIDTPAHYRTGPHFTQGYFRTDYARGSDGNLHPIQVYCPGYYRSMPLHVGATSVAAHAYELHLDFLNSSGSPVWQGVIRRIDRKRDQESKLGLFLPQLLEEFPYPSGAPLERSALLR